MQWFSSDLHFFHKNIVKFTNRGAETTQEEHDEWLVDLWNNQVKPSDTIWHIGDFSFHKSADETCKLLNRLNGNKNLIKGNHDYSKVFDLYHNAEKTSTFGYKEKTIEKEKYVMFHFPIGSWHRQKHGAIHLHGHAHGNYKDSKGKMLDVGLDSAYNIFGRHKFFSIDDVTEIMKTKEIYVADFHRAD